LKTAAEVSGGGGNRGIKSAGKQFRASWLRKATQTDCRVVPALKGQGTQPAGYERHPHTYSDLRQAKDRI